MKVKLVVLGLTLLLSVAAVNAQRIPATGLCNTGLTPGGPLPLGCLGSTPVTPVNPDTGGPSVDGNWQLAAPYPSVTESQQGPNPCALTHFGPAWVDTPDPGWLNPNDGLSQWITPQVLSPTTAGGWYVYRTAFPAPPVQTGASKYILSVTGRVLADDLVPAIFLASTDDGPLGCRLVSLPAMPADFSFASWSPFSFEVAIEPGSQVYLYANVYNVLPSQTGLRIEITSAYFTP